MTINLEILEASFIYDKEEVQDLKTKELVPKMMLRRRLTRASKLLIELVNKVNFKNGRIIYGSSFGELLASANILDAILNSSGISPTDFQNSVYNTPASYASILAGNTSEILTISSGDKTSLKVLKAGAIKALDEDELLLVVCETMNIRNIEEVNTCDSFKECAVALKVKTSKKEANLFYEEINKDDKTNISLPKSVSHMYEIAKVFTSSNNIIEVKI